MRRLATLLCFLLAGLSRPVRAAGDGLSLEQALDQALQSNRTLDNVKQSITQAQLNLRAVRKERLPKLRTNYSYTRTFQDFAFTTEYPSELDPNVMNTMTFSFPQDNYMWTSWISMPVLSELQHLSEQIARLGIDVAKVQLLQAKNELVANVKATYYTILRDERLIEFLTQNLRSHEEHEKLTERYHREGLVAKNSVMEARVERATAQQELRTAQQARLVSHATLATLLGLSDRDTLFAATDSLKQRAFELTVKQCIQFAREHNPELVAYSFLKAQAAKEVKLEKSHLKPTLDLSAYYMKYGDKPDLTNSSGDGFPGDTTAAMLSVNWLITDWGQKRAEARAKKIKLEQLKNSEVLTQDRVGLRVREAWAQLDTARDNGQTARLAIEAARENARLARLRFREQTATSKEVLEALTGLKRAEYSHTTSLHAHNVALARLEEAMGVDVSRIVTSQMSDPGAAVPQSGGPSKGQKR
ncbi:MAG: TolC family protein [Candidatus Riflebacteria bacterium]|nr:TolC family protein [Candidatus Riflebacteria bacterium]